MTCIRNLWFAFAIAVLVGCQTVPADPQADLALRAEGYFKALESQDFRAAYGYLTPGYQSAHTFMEYAQLHRPPGRHTSIEMIEIKCVSDEACDVVGRSQFQFDKSVNPVGGMIVPMDLLDRWLLLDGVWYLVPKR